jgi:Tol biopolymer transport system component
MTHSEEGEKTMPRMKSDLFLFAIAFSSVALLAAGDSYAQQPGGPPASVVFYSARDGHSNNQIYVMDPDGSNQVQITQDGFSDVDPDISPNGQRIVFTSNGTGDGDNDIFMLDRWGLRDLTNNPATDEWARFSPNGREIVFDSNRDGGVYEVFVMNLSTGQTREVTAPPVLGRYPSWSPDGQTIVFRRGNVITVANADGSGTPISLTNETGARFAQMPVFSPDGHSIAFMSTRNGYCSVFRMDSDGNNQTELTPLDPSVGAAVWCSRAPAWSTDGQEIYFMSSRTGQNEIYVMNAADGSNVRQLTSDGTSGSPRARN